MQELTDHNSEIREESIAELVHRALIQAGDMQAAQDKLKEIVQRSSAIVRHSKDVSTRRDKRFAKDGY